MCVCVGGGLNWAALVIRSLKLTAGLTAQLPEGGAPLYSILKKERVGDLWQLLMQTCVLDDSLILACSVTLNWPNQAPDTPCLADQPAGVCVQSLINPALPQRLSMLTTTLSHLHISFTFTFYTFGKSFFVPTSEPAA